MYKADQWDGQTVKTEKTEKKDQTDETDKIDKTDSAETTPNAQFHSIEYQRQKHFRRRVKIR